jgi:type IV secretory pathway VirB2 component (pilin)
MIKKLLCKLSVLATLIFTSIPLQAAGGINNPLSTDSPQELVGLIIKAILGLTGTIALIYFIIGGFMWMTAAGNMDKIKKGRDTLIWATLGLVIIFSAYSLLKFVFNVLPTS